MSIKTVKNEFGLPLDASQKISIGLAASALYISIASWLQCSYVPPPPPPPPPPGTVLELERSFGIFRPDGFAVILPAPSLDNEADTADHPERSPYLVYEDYRPLGPARAIHSEIASLGHGRFSHWKGLGFIISSSDGTRLASNGRRYRVVRPP